MTWALPGMEELKERQESGSQVGLHGLSVSVKSSIENAHHFLFESPP